MHKYKYLAWSSQNPCKTSLKWCFDDELFIRENEDFFRKTVIFLTNLKTGVTD